MIKLGYLSVENVWW